MTHQDENAALESARWVWIDLEMTGLDPMNDRIIEIATIVTDGLLNEVAVGPVIAVRQTRERMEGMDEWNTRQHGGSGLTARVLSSTVSTATAEAETIAFLSEHLAAGSSPMCGNSICQDRRFLARYMPDLEAFFHYRNLDVTTLKILANLWSPRIASSVKKDAQHLALADIRDSIAELRHYRDRWLGVVATDD